MPGGDVGVWQGALRDPSDPRHTEIAACIEQREALSVEVLYTDAVGGQRTISRFTLNPAGEDFWSVGSGRHWYLDGINPH